MRPTTLGAIALSLLLSALPAAGLPAVLAATPKPPAKPAAPAPAKAPPVKAPPAKKAPAKAKPPATPPASASVETKKVKILSDHLTYDRQTELATLIGKVRILQEDTTITTERVRHDAKGKISFIEVPFTLVQEKEPDPKTTLNGDKMTFYHNEKRVYVEGNVKLKRQGLPEARPADPTKREKVKTALKKEDSYIESEKMTYWTDRKDADFVGKVHAYQKEKKAEGDHAFLDNAREKIFMDGHVILTQIKGDWLVREGIVDDSEPDAERDKMIKEKTVMTGDKLEIDQRTNDAVMTGKIVRVEQKGRVATSERAVYTDKDQTITMTQNVKIRRDSGDWINADKAVFHTDSDKFEAFGGQDGQVESEFLLEEE
jgi:lipopolysaccharide assembly outer membrane protein LptD (OstA)